MEPVRLHTLLESNWPGERDPSRHDVRVANELPEPVFLSDFKTSLLTSSEASGNQSIMHLDLHVNEPRTYTYPLALLSDFPERLPPPSELVHLRVVFSKCCPGHPFLERLPISPPSREPLAPPLHFAIGCLASVHARRDDAEAKNLFLASYGLWGSIMEVDNREARSVELLITAILSGVYGILMCDNIVRGKSAVLLCSAITIARRLRFHDSKLLEELLVASPPSYSGAFVWCLWLIDIVQNLHFNHPVTSFTSRELWTTMPDSNAEFQDVYRSLIDERNVNTPLPLETNSKDDALILLMALVSDLLYLRGSLGQVVQLASSNRKTPRANPYIPFSAHTEFERMESTLSLALDKWYRQFHGCVPPELMAFYHYCRVYLYCDQLLELPPLAGYSETRPGSILSREFSVSEDTVCQAWLLLDCATKWSESPSLDSLCPIWLPIIVFHAGLVVWAKHSLGRTQHGRSYGGAKMLLPFKIELDRMPWPCCIEMAETLERLM